LTCDSVRPVVPLKNFGSNTLISAIINYKVDACSSYTGYQWFGSLASGTSTNITLPSTSVTSGSHTYYVSVVSPNAGPDYNNNNDLVTTNFNIGPSPGCSVPDTENFNSNFPPAGWINVDCSNDGKKWASRSFNGGCAWINFYNIASGTIDELIMKPVDLTGCSHACLIFDLAYAQYITISNVDTIAVMVSTNCGSSWDTPYQKFGSALATNQGGGVSISFTPNANQWRTETVDLSPFVGNQGQAVYIKFHAGSGNGNNAYIDNVIVDICTSIEDIYTDKFIEIFPNPSNGNITITSLKNSTISIFNLIGNNLININNITGNKQLDLSKFENGIYIIQIISNNKVTTKKLLLNK